MLHRYVVQEQAAHARLISGRGNRTADRFGDRRKALVKRLGRHLRAIGMTDPRLVAGHSWHHRARSLMEAEGVLPWTADWFLGHARPGEGLGRHSEPSEEQLVAAAKAVPLPATTP